MKVGERTIIVSACEYEALNARLEMQSQELERYREWYKLCWKKAGPNFLAAIPPLPRPNSAVNLQKSYLRPTVASTSRATARDAQEEEEPASDIDGGSSVLAVKDVSQANFLKPTKSSIDKTRPPISWENWDDSEDDNGVYGPWGHLEPPEADSQDDQEEGERRECTECDPIMDALQDSSEKSLKERSRLWDTDFYRTPASTCFVPIRVQIKLLKSAHRLAQETLWYVLRKHWPDIQRGLYLEGPEEIKFGFKDLEYGFGNAMCPSKANEMCHQSRGTVYGSVQMVIYLRNAICHPSHMSTDDVDGNMGYAQGLAVTLLDEARAFKIRKLRDDLQAEAIRVYNEIEANAGLASLPGARPWPLHIQRFFASHRGYESVRKEKDLSEIVKRTIREWKLQHVRPGKMDPTYLANVEKAKSFIRVVRCGRRAGIGSMGDEIVQVVSNVRRASIDSIGNEIIQVVSYGRRASIGSVGSGTEKREEPKPPGLQPQPQLEPEPDCTGW